MAPPHKRPTHTATELHRDWLGLVDVDGPFLAVAPLKRAWPNGIPDFRTTHPERFEVLADARTTFERAWEALDHAQNEQTFADYRLARDEWVQTVLRDVIGWAELLQWGPVAGVEAQSPSRVVTVTAQAALRGAEGLGALVYVVDPVDSLRDVPSDLWAATPVDRLEAMLRNSGVEIGVVTDGRWWGVVRAAEDKMPASGIVDALTWVEEPRVRDALLTLLDRQYIVGGDPADRLPRLFDESIAAAEEITEALGAQVRRAVELLIQSFSESAADAQRRGRTMPLPARTHDTYEAAVTVMMRVVFLLFAEERGLLPTGELFEQGYGIAGELDRLLREAADGEEALDATALTWHRLLATSQALYSGASFENLRMPAYGGSLFDPERFPFLTATTESGSLILSVSDRVMLHVLRSVQIAVVQGEARHISFRDVDVEQIGYIYEGLLGYTCVTVEGTYLGLIGSSGAEPEIPLAHLEALAVSDTDPKKLAAAVVAWVEADQPSAKAPSAAALTKALSASPDPSLVSALTQVVGGDTELVERVSPWLDALRTDLRGHPFIVVDGGLMVKETPSRKNAGAHYTPKSLAEEVVLHALQPLCYSPGPHQTADEAAWRLKSSDEILGLKVADIACGSGAFLVAAGRYLAERVVEAWTAEDPDNAHRKDLYVRAIRQVVANCLYGADINDMAVEMCKLSLWLVSLDRDRPFSFVDDKVFLGNSLLGMTSLDQLRKLHISETARAEKLDYLDVDIDRTIRKAISLRERLASEVDEDDPARSNVAKHRQLVELRRLTADLRKLADGVIAAGLPLGGKPGKPLDEAYVNLRLAAKQAFPGGAASGSSTWLDALIDHGFTPTVPTDYERWQPLHWVIVAPDVMVERGGFDAIVGNPPFLGGSKISGAMGSNLREYLSNVIARGRKGNADLVGYMVLRAHALISKTGNLGVIATNTIAQGDTREVSLDQLEEWGFSITRAFQSRPWPAASASLHFAAVWGTLAPVLPEVPRVVDGIASSKISTLLEPVTRIQRLPVRLRENEGIASTGVKVYGQGFVLEPGDAHQMIEARAANDQVIRPYLIGDDANSRPDVSASRWVIDFRDWPKERSEQFVEPFERLIALVKPERANRPASVASLPFWHYERSRLDARTVIENLSQVLVIALVSRSLMVVRVSSAQIFSNALGIFATESYADQAVLSSSAHQAWAIKYGSGMKSDPRYTPSDVFDTFPRPNITDWLEQAGVALDSERREIMLRRSLGLTKLYNLVNDSSIADHTDADVARLRQIHVDLDLAVIDAYGWSDIVLEHGFHTYRQMKRWTVCPTARVEILDRLLEENFRRSVEESAAGKSTTRVRKAKNVPDETETLF